MTPPPRHAAAAASSRRRRRHQRSSSRLPTTTPPPSSSSSSPPSPARYAPHYAAADQGRGKRRRLSSSSPPPYPADHVSHSATVARLRTGRRGTSSSSGEHMVIIIQNDLPLPQHDQIAIRKQKLARKKGKTLRPVRKSYILSPSTTVGALKEFLQKRLQPATEFILLHKGANGYLSALYHANASLAEYSLCNGDTLHVSLMHDFSLDICDATPLKHRFVPFESVTPAAVDGRFIYMRPSVYYTVGNLKEIICKLTGYNPTCQLLNPLSTRLHENDDKTLLSLGFKSSKEIQRISLYHVPIAFPSQALPSQEVRVVFVVDSLKVASKRDINPNITVKELRCNVLLVGDRFKFSIESTLLEDAKPLSYYNIKDDDVVYMVDCLDR